MDASTILSTLIGQVSGLWGGLMGDILLVMSMIIGLCFVMAGANVIRELLASSAAGGFGSEAYTQFQYEALNSFGGSLDGATQEEWDAPRPRLSSLSAKWGIDAIPDEYHGSDGGGDNERTD